MIQALNQFRLHGHFTDLYLHCDETVFHCHKAVLAAASDTLKDLVLNDQEGFIKIEGPVKCQDMEDVINFAYTGGVEDEAGLQRPGLLKAAAMYGLGGLFDLCQGAMVAKVRVGGMDPVEALKLGVRWDAFISSIAINMSKYLE